MSTVEQQFLDKVADVDPKIEVRQMLFPLRRIVLGIVFDQIGEVTVPMFVEQARELGACLLELAEQLAENETGDLN
jgi:hypothetical protein